MTKNTINRIAVQISALFVLLILVASAGSTTIQAASPSPSPSASAKPKTSPSPSPSSVATPEPTVDPQSTTQKLRERIEKIIEEKRDQIKGVIDDRSDKKRGFVGEIQRISSESLSIKNTKGTQIVPLTAEVIITKKGSPIEIDSIAVGDWAVVLGTWENDTIHVERIMISSTSLRPKTQVVLLGSITQIQKTTMVVTDRATQAQRTFQVTKNTKYLDIDGNKHELKDFQTEIQCLVVAQQDSPEKDPVITTIKALTPLN